MKHANANANDYVYPVRRRKKWYHHKDEGYISSLQVVASRSVLNTNAPLSPL
jgi:hypothetical protein